MSSHARSDKILELRTWPGGVGEGIRQPLARGRYELITAGPNPEFGFIGSDPYQTNAYTGLVVPSTPTAALGGRYLFILARATFGSAEVGVRLVGIRQYVEMVARLPSGTDPLTPNSELPPPPPPGPPVGSTVTFRKEIKNPLWHPPGGNISWHVMVINRSRRDTRNPANTDGLIYEDALSPALLYETFAGPPFAPTAYTPPNGGRPWGVPMAASLGNIHDLRYRGRTDQSERLLDIPIPVPCDVVFFASVRQNDPTTNPSFLNATPLQLQQFAALSEEDKFLVAYSDFAQYGSIYGAMAFDENLPQDNLVGFAGINPRTIP
jgi:hypothetical protein